jgi:hypothetical protein
MHDKMFLLITLLVIAALGYYAYTIVNKQPASTLTGGTPFSPSVTPFSGLIPSGSSSTTTTTASPSSTPWAPQFLSDNTVARAESINNP